jgi:hypothetical protein
MSLSDPAVHQFDKRDCFVLQIRPRRQSPYLLDGTIWVDATNYHIVRVEGTAAAASGSAARPMIERDYTDIGGIPLAVHAKSVSSQALLGETVLEITYQNYKLNVSGKDAHRASSLNE